MPKAKKQDRITHLSKVVFEGYKSIDHLEIDLVKGLNILIGKNGSGKSNFLGLLNSVFNSRAPFPSKNGSFDYYNLAEISMTSLYDKHLKWYTERKSGLTNSDIEGHKNPTPRLSIKEKVFLDDKNISDYNSNKIEIKDNNAIRVSTKEAVQVFNEMQIFFPSLRFVKYNLPDTLIAIETSGNFSVDKRNLSSKNIIGSTTMMEQFFLFFEINFVLKFFPFKNSKSIKEPILDGLKLPDSVIHNLRKFSPIQDVRFSPNINTYEDANRISIENIILEFYVNNAWLPWSFLSDGTKRLFYLISEISYFDNTIILIEEPELGVHPDQFHLIMNFLKEQAEDKQIIMSTHSPEALNILNEDELQNIIITKYDKKKGTTMSHLGKTQIAKAKDYMKEMFLSDYWLLSDLEG